MKNRKKTVLYPGSFDPITKGHIDIVQRALNIFDEIIVLIAGNQRKEKSFFSLEERKEMITQVFQKEKKVKVDTCNGLLMDYARKKQASVIIRGLRAVGDFENEFIMTSMNQALNKEVETLFMITSRDWYFLSSSMLKEVIGYGGDISTYVPSIVLKAIKRKKEKNSKNKSR